MSFRTGFKITRTDGTTRNGYRWPLPMPGDRIRVDATNPTEHDGDCPLHEGDGLCVAKTARAASSGGIRLASCIGLPLEFDHSDVLAESEHKIRVRGVWVLAPFDVLAVISAGLASDLRGANLRDANLANASLREADLSGANLWGTNLRGANLANADLRGANLTDADLTGANLWETNLWGANLPSASLRDASMRGANLWGANMRDADMRGANLRGARARTDWDDLVKRGAIR